MLRRLLTLIRGKEIRYTAESHPHLTEASRAFINSVPRGAWFVPSREGTGFAFDEKTRREAIELSAKNFERLGMPDMAAKIRRENEI